jgi:glycosyltransferase involved in cell wall biosynthesis
MKIAIISSGFLPAIDGVTVTLFNRLRYLSDRQHQVLLFCPDYSSLANTYPDWQKYAGNIMPGVEIINLPSTSFLGLDFERNVTQKSYQIIVRELAKFQPDIIHVDEPERLATGFLKIPGIDFAKRANIPCTSFFHTNFLDYGKDYFPVPAIVDKVIKLVLGYVLSRIYNKYNLTIVSGPVTYQKVKNMGIKNAICGDFLGLDLAKFASNLREENFFEKRYGFANIDSKIKLVFLGRLTPDKGWQFTLDAFAELAKQRNIENIAAIVAGDGSMREEIAQKLKQSIPNVAFLGRILPDEVPALLSNSQIHITASEKETRGLTVLEAMAAGIPVLAPRAGGIIDTIADGENGFLFAPSDRQDFLHKLQLLIDNPDLRAKMAANGKQQVANYTWDNAVANLVRIWEEQIRSLT